MCMSCRCVTFKKLFTNFPFGFWHLCYNSLKCTRTCTLTCSSVLALNFSSNHHIPRSIVNEIKTSFCFDTTGLSLPLMQHNSRAQLCGRMYAHRGNVFLRLFYWSLTSETINDASTAHDQSHVQLAITPCLELCIVYSFRQCYSRMMTLFVNSEICARIQLFYTCICRFLVIRCCVSTPMT